MAQRTTESTNLHDRVIREIRYVLNQKEYDIHLNPGQEKNAGIAGNYPDVIMTIKGTPNVKFILEVETADSITKEEAEGQWKKYANEIKATFYIVVQRHLLLEPNNYANRLELMLDLQLLQLMIWVN